MAIYPEFCRLAKLHEQMKIRKSELIEEVKLITNRKISSDIVSEDFGDYGDRIDE